MEGRGRPYSRQDRQAAGQQGRHQQILQPLGGGHRAPAQPEALLAVLEILRRLHPATIAPHYQLGVCQGGGQIPGFLLASGPARTRLVVTTSSNL